MSDEKDLPSIPSSVDSALRRPLEAMRESIQRLMGMRGADGRAAVRWDDLADEGLASLPRRRLLINQAIEQGATGGGSGDSGGSYVPDLTKPPTPAGLDGVGAITSILLSWTAPAYTVGHGHKQTNVYATKQTVSSSTLYTINDAVRVNTAPGAQTVLAHTSDPNLKWRIWIKFESVDGVESDPAGGVNGFVVSTGQDVTHLLEILTGQIANSQLATALSTKIALIDASASTAGSVAYQVKTETDARVAAIAQEVGDRNTAITAGVNTAKAYTETWAYQKSATDSAIASMGNTVRVEFASADDTTLTDAKAYATNYSYAKSAIDNSFVSLSNTLTTNYQSADTATLNSAKSYADASVSSYAYSKAQTDGAIAASTATVSARLNSGGDVYSSISSAQTTASVKNANFKQSATPTATKAGDTWIDTANGNLLKVWSGSAWVASDDTRIGTAASSISTLQSQIAGSSGSGLLSQIQTEASTRVSETGYIGSLYSVRAQLTAGGKTVIGGFGLMGTSAPGAGTTIDFGVSADKFWVGAPTGSTGVGDIQPFVVQTTDQTVNGVLIPKGVYMDAAYIKNLTAMVSRLGAAWIDNAMVANMSAAKLTVGDGTIGGNLKSSNYSAGSLGWLLRPDGYAEFAAAAIRGQLVSSQINTTGLVVEHANIGALAVDTFQLKDNAVTVPVAAMYGGSPGAAFVLQSYDQDVVSASISVPTGSKISVTVSTVGGLNNQSGLASGFSIYHQVLRDSTVIYYGYTHGIANALNMNWASLDIPFSCTVVDTAANSSSHIYTYRAKYLGSKSGSADAFLLSPTIVVKGVKK